MRIPVTIARECLDTLQIGTSTRIHCPFCSGTRKNFREKDMTVTRKEEHVLLFYCHHCLAEGKTGMDDYWTTLESSIELTERLANESIARKYALEKRCLSEKICREQGVSFVSRNLSPGVRFEVYLPDGNPVGGVVRYVDGVRGPKMVNEPGTPQIVSHIHKLKRDVAYCIWCEGAFDRLSFLEAGLENVLSCPGFALGQKEAPRYLQTREVQNILLSKRSIIATDNDAVGDELAGHLARASASSVRLRFPAGIKDANEYLCRYGKEELRRITLAVLEEQGNAFYRADGADVLARAEKLWLRGPQPGYTTGCPELDKLWMWLPGSLVVVTGYGGSGKSAFVDWLLTNAYQHHGWRSVFCSFEQPREVHALRLAALAGDLPVFERDRPDWKVVRQAIHSLHDRFGFLDLTEVEEAQSLSRVLARIEEAVRSTGAKVAVLDPWNSIAPEPFLQEHQWVARALTTVRNLAIKLDIVFVIIAHPVKPAKGTSAHLAIPTGHDVSGSAAWTTKSDVGITVHRPDENAARSSILCWKLRWDYLASVKPPFHRLTLDYEPQTGRYLLPKLEAFPELDELLAWRPQ